MEKKKIHPPTRRHFLSTLPCLMLANTLTTDKKYFYLQEKRSRKLCQPFTAEEKELMQKSVLARDIENYAGKGYSCAESMLIVSLRFLEKPEECVHAAAAYGGGLGKGDLCGLLTGCMMVIGFAGGQMHQNRLQMKKTVRDLSNEFWAWWESWAPIHCRDLRKDYEGREEYLRMCKRVAVKLEELIKPAI